ncbi:hypothetical protein [Nevskia soli]|uniref:spermine/spermidine synthase domain-containing protein n=1 Tax=Nevskia soli TaxID=418856 RepID=UPI00068F6226|nr:hypothetical protein [Nevskia soli]
MTAVTHRLPQVPEADSGEGAGWCMIPGVLIAERGVVLLREPPHADRTELVKRIRSGKYAKPFVIDDGFMRRLQFNLEFLQSEMSLGDPYTLTFRYTRKMMAFLLFLPNPRHIVIVGLGGGSLTKFCCRQLPRTRVTTVEIDEDVIAFGEWFDLPPQSARMRLVHADARDYFAQANADAPADVILMDGCDERGTAPEFRSALFYENLRLRLRPRGILVVNMAGSVERQRSHRRLIEQAFAGRVIVVDVNDCGNRLAFAFNDTSDFPDLRLVADRADRLEHQHGLDFHEFARLLLRGYRKKKFQSGDVTRQTDC